MTRIMGPQVEELARGCSEERASLCSTGVVELRKTGASPRYAVTSSQLKYRAGGIRSQQRTGWRGSERDDRNLRIPRRRSRPRLV
jgi:hypothetical protein